jgi:hypothetical protein
VCLFNKFILIYTATETTTNNSGYEKTQCGTSK